MKHVHVSGGKPTLTSSLEMPTTTLCHAPRGSIGMGAPGHIPCVHRCTASVVTAQNQETLFLSERPGGENSTCTSESNSIAEE